MIGNDIVDLALARIESNWRRPGFLQKIFTPFEQQLILNADDAENAVWNMWSRKESVYKIISRKTNIRAFISLKIECKDLNPDFGKITFGDDIYFTRTILEGELLHSIAAFTIIDLQRINISNQRMYDYKKDGIPYLNGAIPISISHHGRYFRSASLKLEP